jgi:rRNA-processing protein FCF1
MKRVIIDTNFFLIPEQFRIDIFLEIKRIMDEPYELCVLDKSIEEMKKIILEQRGKEKTAAKIALKLAERVKKLETTFEGSADYAIDRLADENTIVCTQDKALRARVKEKKAKVILLRQKKYLVMN